MKPIILAKDGCKSAAHLIAELTLLMSQPGISKLAGVVKLNDGNFIEDMSASGIGAALKAVAEVTGTRFEVFEDLKTGDVSKTLNNIAKRFQGVAPKILTVNALIATEGFLEIKKALPETEVALFSVPTDMSVEECRAKYDGKTPGEKILSDLEFYLERWEKLKPNVDSGKLPANANIGQPFSLAVCSPRELDFLNDHGMGQYFKWVCAAIRDEWMPEDHQKRTAGIREVLVKGAKYAVMGTQLLKGNPEAGISPEESQQRTLNEVQAAFREMQ